MAECSKYLKSENENVSSKLFYGRNKTTSLPVSIRIKRRLRAIKANHVPKPYTSRLTGPCGSWVIFHRQKDAFDFVKEASKDLCVWSYESDVFVEQSGQRLFLAASPQQFWHYYIQLTPTKRHHYEVIPEGVCCHLYFDLEYKTEFNPGLDGCCMVDIFIRFVCCQLRQVYNIYCVQGDVLQLDASVPSKFSQHLIFHLKNSVFTDNLHTGGFVEHICCLIENITAHTHQGPTSSSQASRQGSAPSGAIDAERTLSHNQKKQEVGQTKEGTTTPSSPTVMPNKDQRRNHKTQPQHVASTSEQGSVPEEAPNDHLNKSHDWKDQLQALKDADLTQAELELLYVNDKEGKPMLFCDRGVYTKNRNFRLFLSCKLGKKNPLVVASSCFRHAKSSPEQIFMDSLVCNVRQGDHLRLLSWDGDVRRRSRQSTAKQETASAEGYCSLSPYPEVDAFVTSVVTSGGRSGKIRRWSYLRDAELLTYDITGNRWCHNVKRPHRNNNVMILADLQRGVYYQKCHDPDCKAVNFKSQEWPLPSNVLPANILGDDDDFSDITSGSLRQHNDTDSIDDDVLRHMDMYADDVPHDVRNTHDIDVWDPLPYDEVISTELLAGDDVSDDVLLAADPPSDVIMPRDDVDDVIVAAGVKTEQTDYG